MTPQLTLDVALAIIVAQGCLAVLLLFAVRKGILKLGQFTDRITENTNTAIGVAKAAVLAHDSAVLELHELREIRQAMALDTELAAARAANFTAYTPHSDREKSA